MSTEKKKKKKSSPLFVILILVCVGIMGFAAYKIISIQMNYRQAQEEYSDLQRFTAQTTEIPEEEQEAEVTEEESEAPAVTDDKSGEPEADSAPKKKKVKKLHAPITVDHDGLKAVNRDYVGWLYIPVVDISYPIMQGPDDEYYLHRTVEGSYLFAGSIFMNYLAKEDFSDPHTLVYGHNMKDTSMFGKLKLITDQRLYETDPTFWILTPGGDFRYRIFSAHTCLDDSDTYMIFSGPGKVVREYIDEMKALSDIDAGDVEYDEDSRIVTLSTCLYAEGHERYVVQGIREN